MTSELGKTAKEHWKETTLFILGVLGFILDHWDIAGTGVSAVWEHTWPILAAYAVVRIFQLGRSFYQRFTTLELQVSFNAVDVDARLEKQAKSFQANLDEVVRSLKDDIQKRFKELDSQADNRTKLLVKVVQHEITVRENIEQQVSKLEAKVIELKNELSKYQKEERTRKGIVQEVLEKNRQTSGSRADMIPGPLFTLGSTPAKTGNTNGGTGTPHDL